MKEQEDFRPWLMLGINLMMLLGAMMLFAVCLIAIYLWMTT